MIDKKKIVLFIITVISIFININGVYALLTLNNNEVQRLEDFGYSMSIPYNTEAICLERRNRYTNVTSSNYKRTECFKKDNLYYYFICNNSKTCNLSTMLELSNVNNDITSNNPYRNRLSQRIIGKSDSILNVFRQKRNQLNEVRYMEYHNNFIYKIRQLLITHRTNNQIVLILNYLLFELDLIECELTGNCNTIGNNVINGVCGSSHLTSNTIAPNSNLCSSGTASTVTTNTSNFIWYCNGSNGGISIICNATKTNTTPTSCNLPWGGNINSGVSINAYLSNIAVSPTTCNSISQIRTCNNGVLSGNYTNQNCSEQNNTIQNPVVVSATNITSTSINWNWQIVQNATRYEFSTNNSNWENLGNVLTKIESTGISCGTNYIRYIRACNNNVCSNSVSMTASSSLCNTYNWEYGNYGACSVSLPILGNWSSCSVSCGGGTRTRTCSPANGIQTRTGICRRNDGVIVDNSYCSGNPIVSQSCNVGCSGYLTSEACNTNACVQQITCPAGQNFSYYNSAYTEAQQGGTPCTATTPAGVHSSTAGVISVNGNQASSSIFLYCGNDGHWYFGAYTFTNKNPSLTSYTSNIGAGSFSTYSTSAVNHRISQAISNGVTIYSGWSSCKAY